MFWRTSPCITVGMLLFGALLEGKLRQPALDQILRSTAYPSMNKQSEFQCQKSQLPAE